MQSPNQITPELAGTILRADLKNVLDKVQQGKPLSAGERAMFGQMRLETEDLQRKRQLSLLHQWSSGKRLKKAELREISDFLPEGFCLEGAEKIALLRDLDGQCDGDETREKSRRSNGYLQPYEYYAALYGKDKRRIQDWVARGKKSGKMCPLDHPPSMRVWWSQHMTWSIPYEVEQAAVDWYRANGGEPAAAPSSEGFAPSSEEPDLLTGIHPVPPEPTLDELLGEDFDDASLSMDSMLNALSRLEVVLRRDAHRAGKTKDYVAVANRLVITQEKLRVEKTKCGELIPKRDAARIIREFHRPIETNIRLLSQKMCQILNMPATPEIIHRWNQACDEVFRHLCDDVFV